jgi:hypothetical protein
MTDIDENAPAVRSVPRPADYVEPIFGNSPEARFTGCLLLFLAAMTLVTVSQHVGILWVAVEATTLASAPLIYFHRHHRSLEATWKYLLVCSVGIALIGCRQDVNDIATTTSPIKAKLWRLISTKPSRTSQLRVRRTSQKCAIFKWTVIEQNRLRN